jgi:FAD/FMN-containing dehydrogenase/Fe-S oxidoreductase
MPPEHPLHPQLANLFADLQAHFSGPLRTDAATRLLYSTDASIYQIEPLGVAFPRTPDDLAAAVALAAQHRIPILARGAGSSLAGQAIGPALILDCSRYLDHILAIDPEARTALVEPGVVLNTLNRAAARHGLQFGPDPASAERATVGGSIANNASGAHSIVYGMCANHILSAEVVLADGSLATFDNSIIRYSNNELSNHEVSNNDLSNNPLARIHATLARLRQTHTEAMRTRWPRTWRNASGYNLPYLFSPSPLPPGSPAPLAPLLAGSEGTLAVIRRVTLNLVPKPPHTILAVLAYPDLAAACDAVPALLEHQPTAVELIPHNLIRLAHTVPAAAHSLTWLDALPAQSGEYALLVIEFAGEDLALLKQRALALPGDVLLAETPQAQRDVWNVRKLGLGILQSQPGEPRPVTFIEDMAVPVENLGRFVREMDRIMAAHGTRGDFYAHASAGCLHMRPILNIKTPAGLAAMRSIAAAAADLLASLGGTISGEHGDGQARGEWLERIYGPEIVDAFRQVKAAFDPHNILNPGKIVDAPPMDADLRRLPLPANLGWQPVMDFSRAGGAPGAAGLIGALEMCNGAGVCRKAEGTMCPSFQTTRDEMHSTRGRANLLRAMLVNPALTPMGDEPGDRAAAEANAFAALDLCLACKGCKADCPSAVDMAKLKYEFMNAHYRQHPRKLRDYLFGYIGVIAPLGAALAPLANWVMRNPPLRRAAERFFGLSCHRPFPKFAGVPLRNTHPSTALRASHATQPASSVLFLSDTFNRYFYPETERAARQVWQALGVRVIDLPILGAGRTLISKGFLEPARKHLARLVEAIDRLDPSATLPIVGLEPSEIYTLRDELLDFFPTDPRIQSIAARAWMMDEFVIRDSLFESRITNHESRITDDHILLHGHCYQKAQPPAADGKPVGVAATVAMLKTAGYTVQVIDDGCCGMAGAFGYEVEHYALSMNVGELALFPAVRAAPEATLVAAGVSCQAQIEDGTQRLAIHPIRLLAQVLTSD